MLKLVYGALALLNAIALIYLNLSTRLAHPDWTENRFFVEIGLQNAMITIALGVSVIGLMQQFEQYRK